MNFQSVSAEVYTFIDMLKIDYLIQYLCLIILQLYVCQLQCSETSIPHSPMDCFPTNIVGRGDTVSTH